MVTDHFHEGKMDVRLGASGARKTEAEKKDQRPAYKYLNNSFKMLVFKALSEKTCTIVTPMTEAAQLRR